MLADLEHAKIRLFQSQACCIDEDIRQSLSYNQIFRDVQHGYPHHPERGTSEKDVSGVSTLEELWRCARTCMYRPSTPWIENVTTFAHHKQHFGDHDLFQHDRVKDRCLHQSCGDGQSRERPQKTDVECGLRKTRPLH